MTPSSTAAPPWQICGHGADPATDPVGCRGIHVGGHTECLAHLSEPDRTAYFTALAPGADIDHRGTTFTPELLRQLLTALTLDPDTGSPHIGDAQFDGAVFSRDSWFDGAVFSGNARFDGAVFSGNARFQRASFTGNVWFDRATFIGDATFNGASFSSYASLNRVTFSRQASFSGASFSSDVSFKKATFTHDARFSEAVFSCDARFYVRAFSGDVWFDGAVFSGNARFRGVVFSGDAWFDRASFTGNAWFEAALFSQRASFDRAAFTSGVSFDWTSFSDNAWFGGIRFETASRLGPLVCGGQVTLDGAVFHGPVTVEIAARQVRCWRTRWVSTATLQLWCAELDLRDAVFEYPVLVAARPGLPTHSGPHGQLLSDAEPGVRLVSVAGVDAAHLVLHDTDLSGCRFAGAVHLDQLRVDGWCTFASAPTGWNWRFLWRWSRRNTLTEEHHWRARTARRPGRAAGWTPPPQDAPELKPAAVAALYRQLRKSLEDGKNEPGAADFYYGECEMRRHDDTRPLGERVLLAVYWALSGYGLRATRALAWLAVAMASTVALMMLWGLPADDPKPQTTGRQVEAGQNLVLTTDTPDPRNPTGPLAERVSTERFEKALQVVINSVVFRSSGQNLTTFGTYTEMTSRLTEPVLLGLAVLAIRSRVKR